MTEVGSGAVLPGWRQERESVTGVGTACPWFPGGLGLRPHAHPQSRRASGEKAPRRGAMQEPRASPVIWAPRRSLGQREGRPGGLLGAAQGQAPFL